MKPPRTERIFCKQTRVLGAIFTIAALFVGCRKTTPAEDASENSAGSANERMVVGKYTLPDGWSVDLPEEYKEHLEEGEQVLSQRGIRAGLQVYPARPGFTREKTFLWRKADDANGPVEVFELHDLPYLRWAKLCYESTEDAKEWVLYSFTFERDAGHVVMVTRFDAMKDFERAKALWLALRRESTEVPAPTTETLPVEAAAD